MKALTIHQPYAELIARGDKRVENRVWRTHHRGDLAIHAGLKYVRDEDLPPFLRGYAALGGGEDDNCDFGAIIAVVEVIDCVHIDEVNEPALFYDLDDPLRWAVNHPEHTTGPWCWILENVRRLTEPIPITGTQMLWEVPPKVVRQIKRRLA
jgi:hypothetical protein